MDREERLRLVGDDSVRTLRLKKGADEMLTTVLEDGSWRNDVQGAVSSVNHGSADKFLAEAQRDLGGTTTIEKGHGHVHEDAHEHVHYRS